MPCRDRFPACSADSSRWRRTAFHRAKFIPGQKFWNIKEKSIGCLRFFSPAIMEKSTSGRRKTNNKQHITNTFPVFGSPTSEDGSLYFPHSVIRGRPSAYYKRYQSLKIPKSDFLRYVANKVIHSFEKL